MKEKITRVLKETNKFIQSDYFIALMGVLTFVGWYFKIWVAMIFIMLTISVIPLFLFKDTKHLLCFLTMFMFLISDNRHDLASYKYLLIPFLLLLVAGFVVSLVRFKRDWSVLSPKKIKGFHLSLLLLIIPFALGGAASPTDNGLAIFVAALLVALIGFGYTFFVVTNTGSEKKKIMNYVVNILYVVGVVVLFEFIVQLLEFSSFAELKEVMADKGEWSLGWGAANNVSPVFLLSIPATLYMCIRKNKFTPIFILIVMAQLVSIILTGCRGALLFIILALPYMLCYTIRKTENKFSFCLTFCLECTVVTVLIGCFSKEVLSMISGMANLGLSDHGRMPLYKEAIKAFKEWPWFGAGWDYKLGQRAQGATNAYTPRWYHSTALQIAANMGVCGIIFFLIFYYWRYRSFLPVLKTTQGWVLLSSLLLFDLYGMIDTNFFGPTFFIILAIISFAAQCGSEDYEALAFKAKPYQWLKKSIKKLEKVREPLDD